MFEAPTKKVTKQISKNSSQGNSRASGSLFLSSSYSQPGQPIGAGSVMLPEGKTALAPFPINSNMENSQWQAVYTKNGTSSLSGVFSLEDEETEYKRDTPFSDGYFGKTASNVLQRKKIENEPQAKLENKGLSNTTVPINYYKRKENMIKHKWDKWADPVTVAYRPNLYEGTADFNHAAKFDEISSSIAWVGGFAPFDKIAASIVGTGNQEKEDYDNTTENYEAYKSDRKNWVDDVKLLPFVARLNSDATQDSIWKMDVLFARTGYGYVIRIQKKDDTIGALQPYKEYMMEEKKNGVIDPTKVITNTKVGNQMPEIYSSKHDTSNTNIGEAVTELGVSGTPELHADSITKMLGEGSRWKAVSHLASHRTLRDNSIFYVNEGHDADKPVQITFQNLWRFWKDPFGYKFAIGDAVLKNKLIEAEAGSNILKKAITKEADRETLGNLKINHENYGV